MCSEDYPQRRVRPAIAVRAIAVRAIGARPSGRRCLALVGMLAAALAVTLTAPGCGILTGHGVETRGGAESFGNLGGGINSRFDDYAPALGDTATLVFTSNRPRRGEASLQELDRASRTNRLYSTMRIGPQWDAAQPYPLFLDERDEDCATISFAPPGSPFRTTAYLGNCRRSDTIGGCDLYAVVLGNGVSMVNLGREVNSSAWDGQPFATKDGERLYFASDRAGGFGGSDIWYCLRTASGVWGAPRNAGSSVNSAADELSPFVDGRDSVLYFASATPGAGFEIYLLGPHDTERRRLPAPFNSDGNDLTPFVADGMFYVASDRTGGFGGYDLYAFEFGGR